MTTLPQHLNQISQMPQLTQLQALPQLSQPQLSGGEPAVLVPLIHNTHQTLSQAILSTEV